MEEVPTKAIRTPSFDQIFLPAMRIVKSSKGFDKLTAKRTIRRGFYAEMNHGKGFDDSHVNDSIYQLRDTVLRMDNALKNGHWIMGEQFTLVDVTLLPTIDRAEDMGMTFLWADLPNVVDWLSRMQSRESVQQAFYKCSRISERFEFKLAVRKARKQNIKSKLSDYLVDEFK